MEKVNSEGLDVARKGDAGVSRGRVAMVFCSSCGLALTDRFCARCGKDSQPADAPQLAASCISLLKPLAASCISLLKPPRSQLHIPVEAPHKGTARNVGAVATVRRGHKGKGSKQSATRAALTGNVIAAGVLGAAGASGQAKSPASVVSARTPTGFSSSVKGKIHGAPGRPPQQASVARATDVRGTRCIDEYFRGGQEKADEEEGPREGEGGVEMEEQGEGILAVSSFESSSSEEEEDQGDEVEEEQEEQGETRACRARKRRSRCT